MKNRWVTVTATGAALDVLMQLPSASAAAPPVYATYTSSQHVHFISESPAWNTTKLKQLNRPDHCVSANPRRRPFGQVQSAARHIARRVVYKQHMAVNFARQPSQSHEPDAETASQNRRPAKDERAFQGDGTQLHGSVNFNFFERKYSDSYVRDI